VHGVGADTVCQSIHNARNERYKVYNCLFLALSKPVPHLQGSAFIALCFIDEYHQSIFLEASREKLQHKINRYPWRMWEKNL
jgi:hypothetical protein